MNWKTFEDIRQRTYQLTEKLEVNYLIYLNNALEFLPNDFYVWWTSSCCKCNAENNDKTGMDVIPHAAYSPNISASCNTPCLINSFNML